ncbi:carbohydrate ABC transporter substrate-binding protein (CUT1 family) [Hydrogenispora ethanolica]|uniref:Carbohydrate ABC transporter substrate-binding protein (CUT1 family) n=1 Tax=Hydrogenispora ethanolica TaxID=1082276 RepID=A0A4R1RXV2_HYDET|nr:extracellular solute-binding protein [Hydrogenispora ethanolica]TCL71571.1 carbohydrate ABC transporter substrate-binding protein (CUT1 family) [Hydrogenispora ethanolica]
MKKRFFKLIGLCALFTLIMFTLAAEAAPKTVTLKLWHLWAADTEANKIPMQKVVAAFEKSHPNIKIEVDAVENQTYKTKIKTAIAANEAPDIFFSWGAGFAQPFVDSKKVLALDPYLKDGTKNRILGGTLANYTYNKKIYGLPLYMWAGVFYVNKELFAKNNIKIPTTYKEMMEAAKAFRAKGITPISVGEKDRWCGMFFQNIFALRTGGAKLCVDALSKKASFDQPAFVQSAQLLSDLVKAKAFNDGCLGLTHDEAQAVFLNGQVPMYYQGSWEAGTFEREGSPVQGKIVAMRFPAVEGGKGTQDEFLGGAIDTFMVSANTKYPRQAATAVKYICENMSREAYLAGGNLPTWKVNVDKSKINPLLAQVAELTKSAKGYVLAWDTFLVGSEADAHLNLVQEIFAGMTTPEQFAKGMQKLNQK